MLACPRASPAAMTAIAGRLWFRRWRATGRQLMQIPALYSTLRRLLQQVLRRADYPAWAFYPSVAPVLTEDDLTKIRSVAKVNGPRNRGHDAAKVIESVGNHAFSPSAVGVVSFRPELRMGGTTNQVSSGRTGSCYRATGPNGAGSIRGHSCPNQDPLRHRQEGALGAVLALGEIGRAAECGQHIGGHQAAIASATASSSSSSVFSSSRRARTPINIDRALAGLSLKTRMPAA